MKEEQIRKNLMVFLHPGGELTGEDYRFAAEGTAVPEAGISGRTVFSFDRSGLLRYLLFPWIATLRGHRVSRKVLHMDDGNLSCLFDAGETAAYRAFAAGHLPPPARFRQWLVSLLPLSIRAERRYVVLDGAGSGKGETAIEQHACLKGNNFMFFSNAAGKLLLTSSATLRSGSGFIVKTTSSPGYAEAMEKEFETMRAIDRMLQHRLPSLPRVGGRFRAKNRLFIIEEYIGGENLREVLRRLARRDDVGGLCRFLDRLDAWFSDYRAAFRGEARSLGACYDHLFAVFCSHHGEHRQAEKIAQSAREALLTITRGHGGVVPMVAHNDLWPGNFVVDEDRLVAVDWERAAKGKAPFFDYYWMIISAVLEYFAGRSGTTDYSAAFRQFRQGGDPVSRHARVKLESFLEELALPREHHAAFLLLFLMEWSVQGCLSLGRRTAMDALAFGELLNYTEAA